MGAGRQRLGQKGLATKSRCHRGCEADRDLSVIVTVGADVCQQTCSQWTPYTQGGGHLQNRRCSFAVGAQCSLIHSSRTEFKSHRRSYIPTSPSTSSVLPPANYVCPFRTPLPFNRHVTTYPHTHPRHADRSPRRSGQRKETNRRHPPSATPQIILQQPQRE